MSFPVFTLNIFSYLTSISEYCVRKEFLDIYMLILFQSNGMSFSNVLQRRVTMYCVERLRESGRVIQKF